MLFASKGTEKAAALYHEHSSYMFREGKILILALELKPQDKIIDLGCGTGRLTREISLVLGREGYVLGIDPDPARIKMAQDSYGRSNRVEFICVKASEIPEDHSPFDGAIANFVLHWLDKDECRETLKHLAKLLRPEAILVANIPAPVKLHGPLEELFRCQGTKKNLQPSLVDAREWSQRLEAAGFAKITISHEKTSEHFTSLEAFFDWTSAITDGGLTREMVGDEAFLRAKTKCPGAFDLPLEHYAIKAYRRANH